MIENCKVNQCVQRELRARMAGMRDLLYEAKVYAIASGAQDRWDWIARVDAALEDQEPVDFVKI